MKTLKQQYEELRQVQLTDPELVEGAEAWEPHPLLVLAGLLTVGAVMIFGTILFWLFIGTAT